MLLRGLGALSATISCHRHDLTGGASAEACAADEADRMAEIEAGRMIETEAATDAEAKHIEARAANARW